MFCSVYSIVHIFRGHGTLANAAAQLPALVLIIYVVVVLFLMLHAYRLKAREIYI